MYALHHRTLVAARGCYRSCPRTRRKPPQFGSGHLVILNSQQGHRQSRSVGVSPALLGQGPCAAGPYRSYRQFLRSRAPLNRGVALLGGRLVAFQRRSGDVTTPICCLLPAWEWLATGVASCRHPLCIRCAYRHYGYRRAGGWLGPVGRSGTEALVSRSKPFQPSFCWQVTRKIFCPGRGSPNLAW